MIVFTVSPDVSISVYEITENGLKCQSVSPKAQNDSVKCLVFCAQCKDILSSRNKKTENDLIFDRCRYSIA